MFVKEKTHIEKKKKEKEIFAIWACANVLNYDHRGSKCFYWNLKVDCQYLINENSNPVWRYEFSRSGIFAQSGMHKEEARMHCECSKYSVYNSSII